MGDVASQLACLGDARLAAHATSAAPVWLWSPDGTRILWANPVGAASFGAATPAAVAARVFDSRDQAAAQIARLAESLRLDGPPRLERLRGFGGGLGRPLVCACSLIALADRTPGILVVAAEPAGPTLALAERVRRLVEGSGVAVAVFAPDGPLLHATPQAQARLGAHTTLAALGADSIAAQALARGRAEGGTALGRVTVQRLGGDATAVLAATFAAAPVALPAEQPAAAVQPPRKEPAEPLPREVDAPPTVPAAPEPPEAPPIAPEAAAVAPSEASARRIDAPSPERRHPLRFVWQMDATGHFTLGSDEFTEVIGPKVAAALGRPWPEVNAALALDPEEQVARAVATRDTWSGITVSWPVDGCADRLKVEMSGLPIFDRSRSFQGYRGFGVCRDIDRIATLSAMRRPAPPIPAPAAAIVAPAPPPADAGPEGRPTLTVVPAAANVVPFRGSASSADAKGPNPVERGAFHELARQFTARLKGEGEADAEGPPPASPAAPVQAVASAAPRMIAEPAAPEAAPADPMADARALLDHVPLGTLIYRRDHLLYANRAFLDWSGHAHLDALAAAGGLDSLFVEDGGPADAGGAGATLALAPPRDDTRTVEGRVFVVPWEGETAHALMLSTGADNGRAASETARRLADARAGELTALLHAVPDGVLVIEPDGRIVAANRAAEALFGYDSAEFLARRFAELLAPTSRTAALAALASLASDASGTPVNPINGEIIGQARQGATLPLRMWLDRIADGVRICAILRDLTAAKQAERVLAAAREATEQAAAEKSAAEAKAAEKAAADKFDFTAKVGHELRTPLNSIIGFAEVMLEERFGPIGNERYRDYLKDIRASGGHAAALLNDLVDLAKIATGQLDLAFAELNLNDAVQACVGLIQPQANRERIIIRTSLAPNLPSVVADPGALHQIALNLLAHSIRLTRAGGQVIVSTAAGYSGEAVLRVRDTGVGMDEKELAATLEPFRQSATASRWGATGTGLCLPLTRALAQANRARFTISSKLHDGTLVEIAFAARGGRA